MQFKAVVSIKDAKINQNNQIVGHRTGIYVTQKIILDFIGMNQINMIMMTLYQVPK